MKITKNPSRIRTNRVTKTFTGGAGAGAAGGNVTVFTVTGEIYIHAIVPFCTSDLTEAAATATVSLGTVSQTTRFIAATNSTTIDANELWLTTTPTAGSQDLPDALQSVIVANGDDIVVACAAQNTNGGVIEFTLLWEPISTDGAVS